MKYIFAQLSSKLIISLDTTSGLYNQNITYFSNPSVAIENNKIVMYENGKPSLAIYLHHMGTVNGVLPTDINDAFNKITTFITSIFVATTGGGGATPEQLALKTDKGGYTGSAKDLENTFVAAVTGASGISIVPTSPAPAGTGIASFTATQAGTYTNYGGVVVAANSFAIISRSATGVFSISQTAFNLTSYATKRNSKALVQRNVFSADATGTDISNLEDFILDFRFISGTNLVPTNKHYVREILFSGSQFKFEIRKDDETSVINYLTNSFTPPTDETRLAHKIILSSGSLWSIEMTVNWDNYFGKAYNTTSFAQYKLNNAVLFGQGLPQLENRINVLETRNVKIASWTAKAYVIGDQVNYLGKDWVANVATVAGDIPETSTKWTERLTGYLGSKGVILDDTNLFNKGTVTPNKIIKIGGAYTIETNTYYQVTDFMPIDVNRTFIFTGSTTGNYTDGGCLALFTTNSDASYLGAVVLRNLSSNLKATVANYPTAKFVKFTLRKVNNDDLPLFSYSRQAYDFVTLETTLATKISLPSSYLTAKINALGDSYTALGGDANRGFIYQALSLMGLNPTTQQGNYGTGGTRIANNSLSVTDTQAIVNRYNLVPYNEVLLLLGGFNDGPTPYTTWAEKIGTISDVNTTTIYGAYKAIIEGRKINNIYSNESIILMTYPYTQANADKILLNQTIREVALFYNLPLIDFERNCNFIKGVNCDLQRASFTVGKTWIDGTRINYNNGTTFLTDAGWAWIDEYIPVNVSLYKYISQPINCNVFQYYYNGSSYVFIKYGGAYESVLEPNCTHIRISATLSQKASKWTITDGEYVTDGTHPNLLGFARMTPLLIENLKSIL
jgi:hypothetical protein